MLQAFAGVAVQGTGVSAYPICSTSPGHLRYDAKTMQRSRLMSAATPILLGMCSTQSEVSVRDTRRVQHQSAGLQAQKSRSERSRWCAGNLHDAESRRIYGVALHVDKEVPFGLLLGCKAVHRKAAVSVLGAVNGETASGHLALRPALLHHPAICTPCYHWPCREGRLPLL